MKNNKDEKHFMQRCLRLAARGRGLASPNPMVGAVVVKDGRVVGEGFHVFAKKDHAEIVALQNAGADSSGADLYVSLEPCCYPGRTSPCVDAIVERKIKRVLVAVEDPNPRVDGQGIEFLRKAGLEVDVGLCREAASRLNAVFFHYITRGRPFVTLKLALTLDGKVAARGGESKWITSFESRKRVHRLRFESDAVLVGIGTVLKDDPRLNVRWQRRKQITKVVLDTNLRTPEGARLFNSRDPVRIYHSAPQDSGRTLSLQDKASLIRVQRTDSGLDLEEVLQDLGRSGISSLLVEGGPKVATALVRQKQVNRLYLFYGPKLVGSDGKSAFGRLSVKKVANAWPLQITGTRRIGTDILVEGQLK